MNATGPPGHDARKYGWVRKMHSGFGFVRLNAKSRKELQIQFVQAIRCPPPPPPTLPRTRAVARLEGPEHREDRRRANQGGSVTAAGTEGRRINAPAAVDAEGRSLHVEGAVGCGVDCGQLAEPDGQVWDSVTIRRRPRSG